MVKLAVLDVVGSNQYGVLPKLNFHHFGFNQYPVGY
jgi:hypothetical protein